MARRKKRANLVTGTDSALAASRTVGEPIEYSIAWHAYSPLADEANTARGIQRVEAVSRGYAAWRIVRYLWTTYVEHVNRDEDCTIGQHAEACGITKAPAQYQTKMRQGLRLALELALADGIKPDDVPTGKDRPTKGGRRAFATLCRGITFKEDKALDYTRDAVAFSRIVFKTVPYHVAADGTLTVTDGTSTTSNKTSVLPMDKAKALVRSVRKQNGTHCVQDAIALVETAWQTLYGKQYQSTKLETGEVAECLASFVNSVSNPNSNASVTRLADTRRNGKMPAKWTDKGPMPETDDEIAHAISFPERTRSRSIGTVALSAITDVARRKRIEELAKTIG